MQDFQSMRAEAQQLIDAAENGDPEALFKLGMLGLDGYLGHFKETTIDEYGSLIERAAKGGHPPAMTMCAMMVVNSENRDPEGLRFALNYLEQASELGELDAKCQLALIYKAGVMVPKDHVRASQLWKVAADAGHLESMVCWAESLEFGIGVKQNKGEAIKVYEQCIVHSHPIALNNLSDLLEENAKTYEEFARVASLRHMASDLGMVSATFHLADQYYYGKGVPQDTEQAKTLANLAFTAGHQPAQTFLMAIEQREKEFVETNRVLSDAGSAKGNARLGACFFFGHGCEQDYQKARGYLLVAAKQNHANSMSLLGSIYDHGLGVAEDHREALKWYEKAANLDDFQSQHNTALMYEQGLGTKQDSKAAFKWHLKAAANGHAGAQHDLGYCYAKGRGTAKDYKKAFSSQLKAANQGLHRAQCEVAQAYLKAQGVEKDDVSAEQWYEIAAQNGNLTAQFELGRQCLFGPDFPQDIQKGVKWMRVAAEQGDEQAQGILVALSKIR